jgi:sulfur carrier protein
MQIIINGDIQQVAENNLTISRLLEVKKVESPDMVSVQLNGDIINRELYDSQKIEANDAIDFLYFMGGGAA